MNLGTNKREVGAGPGHAGGHGGDLAFTPESHKAMKENQGTGGKVLPSKIPPKPGEKRLGRGSEWTPANLQFL